MSSCLDLQVNGAASWLGNGRTDFGGLPVARGKRNAPGGCKIGQRIRKRQDALQEFAPRTCDPAARAT